MEPSIGMARSRWLCLSVLATLAASVLSASAQSVAASDLPIHRRPECVFEKLWDMDFSADGETIDALENPTIHEPAEHSVTWERLEACGENSPSDSQSVCYARENVKLTKARLSLSATVDAGARVRVEKQLSEPWKSSTRLRVHVKFPFAEEQPRARITTTIQHLNAVFTIGLIRTVAEEHQLSIVSPTHNVSLVVGLPCGTNVTRRFHDLDLEWNTQWLRWYWDGRVLYEHAQPTVDKSGSKGSIALDFAIASSSVKSKAFQIKSIHLHQATDEKALDCRPRLAPDTNCRHHTAFQPRRGADQGYLSLNQVNAYLHNVSVSKQFPSTFTRLETIGHSYENRSILALCVGACASSTAPQVLFTGMHHSREPLSMMNLIYTIDLLALDLANGVLDVLTLLYSRQLWFIPVVNPDGYARNEQLHMWNSSQIGQRKNTRPGGCSSVDDGVDLNRNYDICFDLDERGSQKKPCEEDYRGPAPFSEPETQAIKGFIEHKDSRFSTSLNYHSFGRYFNIPFACEANGEVSDETDRSIYKSWASEMTRFNGFKYGQPWKASNLYTVNGETSDWMWAAHGIFAMSPEVGPAFTNNAQAGFWPPMEDVPTISTELYYSNLVAARIAGPIYELNVVRVAREKGSNSVTLAVELVNHGLRTVGNIELVASLTLDESDDVIASEVVGAGELGTLRNGTLVVKRDLIVPVGDVVHVLVRDDLTCRYTRVSVASPSESSDMVFEQYQALDLPLCGVCATLGRGGIDSAAATFPRCESVRDLVSADTLAFSAASPRLKTISSSSTPVTEDRGFDPDTESPATETPSTPESTDPVTSTTNDPVATPTPSVSSTPSASSTSPTASPSSSTVPPKATEGGTALSSSTSESSASSWTSLSSIYSVPIALMALIVLLVALFVIRRRSRRHAESSGENSSSSRGSIKRSGRKTYAKVGAQEEDDDDDASADTPRVRALDIESDDEDAEYGRRRNPNARSPAED
ncbi:hypothetical protein Poli38472_004699 [Pythium oligandrum]|uniref:Peptidase M14 domain-containing protein n=1 Tax=Pythium oligandrum TaxID=41045 RepID=A0A8K1CB90_PYTOL|nr:hypothetical protein Poli38472_004699 [Pythium oligandrum]|eukprot:TMW59630.1 hypothetical protein Poli38472_004699 [Pythium oligandrum]